MRPNEPVLSRIASLALALAAFGCSGSSSGLSGRYEADLGGGSAVLEFHGSNKVDVSLVSGEDKLTHHCVYTVDGNKLVATTDEPMGVPMHLVIDGDVLRDQSGGVVYRKK